MEWNEAIILAEKRNDRINWIRVRIYLVVFMIGVSCNIVIEKLFGG